MNKDKRLLDASCWERLWGNWVLFWWTGPWSVQFCSVTQSWPTLVIHGPQHTRLPCPSLIPRGCLNSCPSSWWCHPTISSLSSLSPPAFNLSQHQGISNESGHHIRWPNFWSFSISPSNEYSKLISFRIGWLYLLVIQGTLKSSPTLQFKSISSSVLNRLHSVNLQSNFLLMGRVVFCPCFCPEAKLSTHASVGDSWTLTGKSGSVSHWPPNSNYLGFSVPLASSRLENLLWVLELS